MDNLRKLGSLLEALPKRGGRPDILASQKAGVDVA